MRETEKELLKAIETLTQVVTNQNEILQKHEHFIKCLEDRVEELEDNKAEKDGLGELFKSMNPNNI